MNLFGKGKISDDDVKADGVVLVRISVDRIDRKKSKVKVIVIERNTGDCVYKLRFNSDKSEFATYNIAESHVKRFINENDYVIDGDIHTNAQLPFVGSVSKGNRWG